MRAIIIVFKGEFEGKDGVVYQLKDLTKNVKVVLGAYIFSPKPGKLFELLNTLKENKINYGTHFDSAGGARVLTDSERNIFE